MSKLTPMMLQYMQIKEQYKDALLFFRLGDFYEMFFEDAVVASKELEITLTGRDCGLSERAPMCGVPYHAAEGYISRLIEKGYKVAICEQVQDPSEARGIVERDVVRIITPGTLIEASMLNERENNYILAVHKTNNAFGLSWADISTGEFYTCEFNDSNKWNNIIDILSGIAPSEIIIQADDQKDREVIEGIGDRYGSIITPYTVRAFEYRTANITLLEHFAVNSLDGFGIGDMSYGISAAGALLSYLKQTQKTSLKQITSIRPYHAYSYMMLDMSTRRNLELTETMRSKTKKGSLLWLLDKTNTAMGSRLLRQWIQKPLTVAKDIIDRLDAVEELTRNPAAMKELELLLKKVYDLERLVGRITYGNANARDLISLGQSLETLPKIKKLLASLESKINSDFHNRLDLLTDVHNLIKRSINEDPPASLKDGSIIRKGYNSQLDELLTAAAMGKDWLADLEKQEKERTGIKNLKVGFNKVFGYYIEVTKSYYDLVPGDYTRKQTLANSERYITPELKETEETILGAEKKSINLEYKLFVEIRNTIAEEVERIQNTAHIIATLDVLSSLAKVALINGYIKPSIDEGDIIDIIDGRHPVVEKTLPHELFVPNDTYLDNSTNQVTIITGPNMAGKSTYMRQVAIIVLMAQIGSFVPANKAHIGVVDRIFTRVGASDDLTAGQSTFMVEMSELANILHNATPKSLLILDEIGRGTSTYDGLSIAWAVVEYICNQANLGSKTLFATHYHELTELEGKLDGVKNFYITVKEQGNDIVFLRKITRGGAEKSLGIQVARLAGLPLAVIERASKILNNLEDMDINKDKSTSCIKEEDPQISSFDPGHSPIEKELGEIDILNVTPMEAMNILSRLIEKSKRK
ncbi:MAG: DNA mismatch repair protein MutS [Clostridiales bacterium]|nr:DNA mismatch repair protein MutS [Clostridiales bacterium]